MRCLIVADMLTLVDNRANIDEVKLLSLAAFALRLEFNPLFFLLLEKTVNAVFGVLISLVSALAAGLRSRLTLSFVGIGRVGLRP